MREIAAKLDMASAEKRDSQGICFVGKVHLPTFLQQKLAAKKGDIIEISANQVSDEVAISSSLTDEGQILEVLCSTRNYDPGKGIKKGEHNGAHFFTIGQRKGLDVGGTPEPLFIIATDIKENVVYVGQGKKHPGLYRKGLFIQTSDIHWVRPDLALQTDESDTYKVRIRYRQELQEAKLYMREFGLYIVFENSQRGVTSGQFAAWYKGNELIGSGVIE